MDGFTIIKVLVVVAVVVAIVVTVAARRSGEDLVLNGWWFASLMVVWITAGGLLIAWGLLLGDRMTCRNTAASLGLEYEYHVSTPCLVNYEGTWIPLDQVIRNDPVKED